MFRHEIARFYWILAIALLMGTPARGQGTLYVNDDACPSTGAGTQVDPLCRIQRAIELSKPGDEIVVAPGTYNELINFIGKGITVRSLAGAESAVIDAGPVPDPGSGKPVVRCDSGEGRGSVLKGFTLTGGTGQIGKSGTALGGGMFIANSDPTVIDCVFAGNTASEGGGMFVSGGSPAVNRCSFDGNDAVSNGGGMAIRNGSHARITKCTFSANTAVRGAGIHNSFSDPAVTDCTFDNNASTLAGGGIYNTLSHPVVNTTKFFGNIASGNGKGGGIYNVDSSPTVANSIFSGNEASDTTGCCPLSFCCTAAGGGMFSTGESNPTLINSTFAGNVAPSGAGIASASGTTILINCILSNNGVAIPSSSIVRFSNIEGSGGSSNWQGGDFGTDGGGNIDVDPLFVDADGTDDIPGTTDDDVRLSPGSPSIDAGFSFGTLTDLDGNTRIIDDPATPDTGVGFPVVIDMGAYEFGGSLSRSPDLNSDGDVDIFDFALMEAAFTGPVPPPPPPPPECTSDASCDDQNECTVDTCVPFGDCMHSPVNCDDGDLCNGAEVCDPAGGCLDGTPPCAADEVCDPADGTCAAMCLGDADCDLCLRETCVAGVCAPGTPINCDDGDPCTTDTCAAGVCFNFAVICPTGEICDFATGACVLPQSELDIPRSGISYTRERK